MSIFQEYDNDLMKDYDILFRRFEIDIDKLDNELMFESSFCDMENELFCESEERTEKKKQSSFTKIITQIADTISNFIKDVLQMFSDMFKKSTHIDIEAYLNSAEGSIEFEEDIERVHEQVKAEVRKGRKLIQNIAKATKINDAEVERYVENAAKGVKKHGRSVVNAASSYIQFERASQTLENLKLETLEALKDCKDAAGDPTKEIYVSRVYKAMKRWVVEAARAYSMYSTNMYREALKQKEKQEKEKKGGH